MQKYLTDGKKSDLGTIKTYDAGTLGHRKIDRTTIKPLTSLHI